MKYILLIAITIASSCNNDKEHKDQSSTKNHTDTTITDIKLEEVRSEEVPPPPPPPPPPVYANERFKDIAIERNGTQFRVKGKARVFEANVSWVVEDGHNELKKGFVMTDAGAPAWGNFTLDIDIKKTNPNSTLTLILFESSPKDGSRQYELPVVLY